MSKDCSNSGTPESRTEQEDQEVQYNTWSTAYACVYENTALGECLEANTHARQCFNYNICDPLSKNPPFSHIP